MESKNAAALALIIIGAFFLLKNLNVLPTMNWSIVWPLLIIGLGIAALYQSVTNRKTVSNSETWVQVGDWETDNPILAKLIGAIVIVFVVAVVGFVLLGVIAPIFLFVLFLVPVILFFRLGAAFLKFLIPIGIFLAPFLLIIWLLSLLF
ncbi:MAG: hypothetical protein GX331_00805 [Firmicutes bacterium]|nr:hypothetical protein [Bacillota bacterium]